MKILGALSFLVFLSGCMMSEQEGRLPQDLTFHFNTGINYFIGLLRVGGALALALWFRSGWKNQDTTKYLAWALYGIAAFFLIAAIMNTQWYRVEARPDGLYMRVPPGPGKEMSWDSIQGFEIEGQTWGGELASRDVPATMKSGPTYELPEWHRMTIVLTDGESLDVNLKRLSVEQRQNLWKAIAFHGRLTQTR